MKNRSLFQPVRVLSSPLGSGGRNKQENVAMFLCGDIVHRWCLDSKTVRDRIFKNAANINSTFCAVEIKNLELDVTPLDGASCLGSYLGR